MVDKYIYIVPEGCPSIADVVEMNSPELAGHLLRTARAGSFNNGLAHELSIYKWECLIAWVNAQRIITEVFGLWCALCYRHCDPDRGAGNTSGRANIFCVGCPLCRKGVVEGEDPDDADGYVRCYDAPVYAVLHEAGLAFAAKDLTKDLTEKCVDKWLGEARKFLAFIRENPPQK